MRSLLVFYVLLNCRWLAAPAGDGYLSILLPDFHPSSVIDKVKTVENSTFSMVTDN